MPLTERLKKMYDEKGIRYCEARIQPFCKRFFALSWHHRYKRRWYKTKDKSREKLLASFNHTILVCGPCHNYLEQHADETYKAFMQLRGEETLAKENEM